MSVGCHRGKHEPLCQRNEILRYKLNKTYIESQRQIQNDERHQRKPK